MKEVSILTKDYVSNSDSKYRKKMGQYFTSSSIKKKLFEILPLKDDAIIAEPSAGTGEFISSIQEVSNNPTIDAWEVDKNLCDVLKKNFNIRNLYCEDTLTSTVIDTYDYVIGNPPYFEYTPTKEVRELYSDVISGRVNIYSLFIKRSIEMAKNGGYVALVVPQSMLNGSYFKNIRGYIMKTCSIENITLLGEKDFDGVQHPTMILVLKKGTPNKNYTFERNGIVIFSNQWERLEKVCKNSTTLYDLGFRVKTGNVVWNQHKEKLVEEKNEDSVLLVWSHNISKDCKFMLSTKKPQYVMWNEPETKKTIIVNRITGAGKNAKIRACIMDGEYVCENHINVIYGNSDIISIDDLLEHINNEKALSVMQEITGNTQISKTELERLFPIWL